MYAGLPKSFQRRVDAVCADRRLDIAGVAPRPAQQGRIGAPRTLVDEVPKHFEESFVSTLDSSAQLGLRGVEGEPGREEHTEAKDEPNLLAEPAGPFVQHH
jgi:hypothetical protein